MNRAWVRAASSAQAWGQIHWRPAVRLNRVRAIAINNHRAQARRHRERLLSLNKTFAEPARWKRRVPSFREEIF
jgi:hypothetical protein